MQPLSATDAICSRLATHSQTSFLDPRNPRLFFKIAAIAFFAELANFSFSFSSPGHSGHGGSRSGVHRFALRDHLHLRCRRPHRRHGALHLSSCGSSSRSSISCCAKLHVAHLATPPSPLLGVGWAFKLLLSRRTGLRYAHLHSGGPLLHSRHLLQSHGDHSHIVSFILTMFAFVVTTVITVAVIILRQGLRPPWRFSNTPARDCIQCHRATRAETGQVALYVLLRVFFGIAGTCLVPASRRPRAHRRCSTLAVSVSAFGSSFTLPVQAHMLA